MRLSAAVAALALAVALTGCNLGPLDATQSGGAEADPVALLTLLPSPDALRGPPAEAADPAALQRGFTGDTDTDLATAIAARSPIAAGVRAWAAPDGTLTAAVSVWDSHLVATQVGAQIASRFIDAGASAWTPGEVGGARGARTDDPSGRTLVLAYSVGPNSLYVRSTGAVPEATVTKTLNRLIAGLKGQGGEDEGGG